MHLLLAFVVYCISREGPLDVEGTSGAKSPSSVMNTFAWESFSAECCTPLFWGSYTIVSAVKYLLSQRKKVLWNAFMERHRQVNCVKRERYFCRIPECLGNQRDLVKKKKKQKKNWYSDGNICMENVSETFEQQAIRQKRFEQRRGDSFYRLLSNRNDA